MAARQGDIWYSDPKDFRDNYIEDPSADKGQGYRTFIKKPPSPPQEPRETAAPATVQGAINERAEADQNLGYADATPEQIQQSKNTNGLDQKRYYWLSQGFSNERAMDLARANAPYVPW